MIEAEVLSIATQAQQQAGLAYEKVHRPTKNHLRITPLEDVSSRTETVQLALYG